MGYFQREMLAEWSPKASVADVSAMILGGDGGPGQRSALRLVNHQRDRLQKCVWGVGRLTKNTAPRLAVAGLQGGTSPERVLGGGRPARAASGKGQV